MEQAGLELIAKNAGQYITDVTKAEHATQSFVGGLGKTTGFDAFEQIAVGAFRRVGEAAIELAANAGQELIAFMSDSITVAGDFEAGMNSFAAVAGGALQESGLSIEQFKQQFIDLGKELPVSTSDVQQAAIELVKGGIDPATIAAGGLRQSLQFAAAAGLDLEQAATIVAKAVGGWTSPFDSAQTKADFLTHSTDMLARAANASSVNVDDLALGLYNVQGTAKLAGASFDETVTALAQLAPGFASSADAGTSLKAFFSRLQPSTKPAIAAMQDLGLWTKATGSAFYDAAGNFVGMEKASALLHEATKGLTKAQQEQYLQTIFGQDAIRVAGLLAEQGAEGYSAMADSLAKQNSVADLAAQKQQGFNTVLKNAKGSVEALQITIGTALLPVLSDLLNSYITPGVNQLITFADAILQSGDPVGYLASQIQNLIGPLQSIGPTILTLAGPIGWMIGMSFTLADAWNQNLGDIQGSTSTIMTTIATLITTILTQIELFWWNNGAQITAFVQQTWTQISQIIALALQLINATIVPALQGIASFISQHSTEIQGILSTAWTIISTMISTALETIKGLIALALAVVKGDWAGAWDAIKAILVVQLDGAIKILDAGMTLFKTVWGLAWEWIVTQVQSATGGIVGWIIQTMIAIRNTLSQWVGTIGAVASQVGDAIANGIAKGIESGVSAIINAAKQAAQSALDAAMKLLRTGSPSRAAADLLGEPFSQGFAMGIANGSDGVQSAVGDVLAGVLGAKNLTGAMQQTVQTAISAMEQAFQGINLGNAGFGFDLSRILDQVGTRTDRSAQTGAAAMRTTATHDYQTSTITAREVMVNAQATVQPVAAARQFSGSNSQQTYNANRTYNMPIYTTQSPAVVQQSMQIAQALAL